MEGGLERKLHGSFKSEGERRVAQVLDQYGIFYVYEQPVKINVKGTVRTFRPDFYLPRLNVYIEYFGRAGNSDYDQRTRYKKSAYATKGLHVISVYPWTLCQNWPQYLLQQLQPSKKSGATSRNNSQDVSQRSYRPPSRAPREAYRAKSAIYRPRPTRAYGKKAGAYRPRGGRGR